MRLKLFNVRGIRGKETILLELMTHTKVLGLSETWFNGEEMVRTAHMSVGINQRPKDKNNRSFGGVALAVVPINKYRTISKVVDPKYQFLTVGLIGLTISTCYVFPSATGERTEEAMDNIQKHAGDRATVLGDVNGRPREGYVTTGSRGND